MELFKFPKGFFASKIKKFTPVPNRVTFKKFAHLSFYKRKEPTLGINFISPQSKKMLFECIRDNTANPYFPISDQYITQADPAFCGPTNLALTLNTLQIDPKIKWKGIWRWYCEENIKCIDIEKVKDYGMTLPEFSALLKCNSAKNNVYRPSNKEFPLPTFLNLKKYHKFNMNLIDDLKENEYSPVKHVKNCQNKSHHLIPFNVVSSHFLRTCTLASAKYDNFILMCNLGRGGLQQTGDGHFTPITAYHQQTDTGLLLDSARFKYNSRWYKIDDIYNSLIKADSFTNKPRGFMLIEKNKSQEVTKIEVNESSIVNRIKRGVFPTSLESRAKLINWFMFSKRKIENKVNNIWENVIIKKYNEDKKFREYVNFVYMYDHQNLKSNLLSSLMVSQKLF